MRIENNFIPAYSLATAKLQSAPRVKINNPVIQHSLKIWSQFRRFFNLQDVSFLSPLLHNHLFTPSKLDLAFRAWHSNGVCFLKDLYIDGVFASFNQLFEKCNLKPSDHFRYFQIRHFVQQNLQSFPNMPLQTPLDKLLATEILHRGAIPLIYNFISNLVHRLSLV